MTELQKLYKEYSNRELITILHEKNKFIPEAIEQALAEIKNRNLTQQEFDKEKNDIILQKENRKQQIQKARASRK
ncbi:hypothetical protein Q4517_13370 [Tenacibaculum sp. 1_MG-2023]|uniref:hypothetical protein n=1 Tax=Tenacibaculum sp. 1_MG-2023 TaxID=3062653 RepID=UPI0026E21442|nr:hypothetical protein [Tenacibaculum sp. 1_MG-2023]MDO6676533.1 hypothetical protein [Tenacibaculum sp. 1_MG-2023]